MAAIALNDLAASGTVSGLVALAAVAFVAGAVNAVAGGGTILTFPVLAAILPADPARLVTANATSTIGLWPGAVAAAWAYRGERVGQPSWTIWLAVPSLVGAAIGAVLLLVLPSRWFDAGVPWLILTAAVVFALQPQFARLSVAAPSAPAAAVPATSRLALACVLQFIVAVYGGYFGAGIGILMLAVLGVLGLGDIHRVNAVKNVMGMTINGVAAGLFAMGSLWGAHDVSWVHAAIMAAAAVAGSLAGSQVARRLPARLVRRCVALIGFALAAYSFAA
ncbi:MAG: sulfite exporter TauE/SafE family protein [Planctomycetia bacterium]